MFRVRRLILRLTIAGSVIPLASWIVTLIVPTIGEMLGRSGHPIGKHYVVRYISDYAAIKIYRDGYEAMRIDSVRSQLATCLMFYGLICLLVASIEGTLRLVERRGDRRRGFEVLRIHPTTR